MRSEDQCNGSEVDTRISHWCFKKLNRPKKTNQATRCRAGFEGFLDAHIQVKSHNLPIPSIIMKLLVCFVFVLIQIDGSLSYCDKSKVLSFVPLWFCITKK
jgi:hypothetical protein